MNGAALLVYGPLQIAHLEPRHAVWLVGLLFAVPSLTAFAGHNLWGVFFDRVGDPRRFFLLSMASDVLFFGFARSVESGGALVVSSAVSLFFSVALIPASQAAATLAREDAKGRVLGQLHACESGGWGLGTLLGGVACLVWPEGDRGVRNLFGLAGLVSLAALVLGYVFFPRKAPGSAPLPPIGRAALHELAVLYRRPPIARLAIFTFALTAANSAFFSYFSLYLCGYLGGTREILSISMTAATLGGALLFPAFGILADRIGRRGILTGSVLAYATYYLALGFVTNPVVVALLFALPLYPAIRVATNAWLADLTAPHERAGGMGLLEGVASLAAVVGPGVGWCAITVAGYGALPIASLGLLLGGGLLLGLSLRHDFTQSAPVRHPPATIGTDDREWMRGRDDEGGRRVRDTGGSK